MTRRDLLTAAGAPLVAGAQSRVLSASPDAAYQIGAYYFPNYHVDPRNEEVHGKGWTEWEVLKRAGPRFPGHQQPKVPLWGYEDESDPKVFQKKINAAADHGITHFLFDWYWYEQRPFLERPLERAYLKAPNNRRLKFALMWANHNWRDIQPAKRNMKPLELYSGEVSSDQFDRMADYIISTYFRQPTYWKIDGRPFFSMYQVFSLISGLGGAEKTKVALTRFRHKVREAGFPDLHLNAMVSGIKILPGEQVLKDPKQTLQYLGFDSVDSYVWVHHSRLRNFPETDYAEEAADAAMYWERAIDQFGIPYHPNVTMGWDPSPRCCQSDRLENAGYPFTATLKGNTPEAFQAALQSVKRFLDSKPRQSKIFTINAWNEWTEGSYLEPDTIHKLQYLEAIKATFL